MILFDKLDLNEQSKNSPIKILYCKLEYSENKKVIFIGIINFILNDAKNK